MKQRMLFPYFSLSATLDDLIVFAGIHCFCSEEGDCFDLHGRVQKMEEETRPRPERGLEELQD